jgi:AGZA family xanthine/uracil permease-like MFS transporter
MLHYHVKGAFCSGLLFGTVVWWLVEPHSAPKALLANPVAEKNSGNMNNNAIVLLIFNLLFLYILVLNGLSRSMSDLAGLTKKSGAIPRAGWLFIVCGLTTILSGYFSGPPILISPESAAGIKAGAKTGLSTLVCGILFAIATFFYPVFAAVPATGTAPLLLMVGVLLFQNVKRIDWTNTKEAVRTSPTSKRVCA